MKILVINPGSTSTKIALYSSENQEWMVNIEHDTSQLAKYTHINEQLEMRKNLVMKTIAEKGLKVSELSAIVARGGLLPPIRIGAYAVNEAMVDQLLNHAKIEHASNLAAPIGYSIAKSADNIPVYIYDGVTADEMLPITKITGLKEITRCGRGHNLNCRAAFMEYAKRQNKSYKSITAEVVHLGGGITVTIIQGGRIIDLISDDEGPFSPERAGGLPYYQLLDMAMDGQYDKASLLRMLRTRGGYMSYFGTTDNREVEKRMLEGDKEATFIYEALILNIAKNIAKLSATVSGNLEAIILTGGMAHSKMLTKKIADRVAFIAPTAVIPGENEMQALAFGALRSLRGEEQVHIYG